MHGLGVHFSGGDGPGSTPPGGDGLVHTPREGAGPGVHNSPPEGDGPGGAHLPRRGWTRGCTPRGGDGPGCTLPPGGGWTRGAHPRRGTLAERVTTGGRARLGQWVTAPETGPRSRAVNRTTGWEQRHNTAGQAGREDPGTPPTPTAQLVPPPHHLPGALPLGQRGASGFSLEPAPAPRRPLRRQLGPSWPPGMAMRRCSHPGRGGLLAS